MHLLATVREVVMEACQVGHFPEELKFRRQCWHVDQVSGKLFHLEDFGFAGVKGVNDCTLCSVIKGKGDELEVKVSNVEGPCKLPGALHNSAVCRGGCREEWDRNFDLTALDCGEAETNELHKVVQHT